MKAAQVSHHQAHAGQSLFGASLGVSVIVHGAVIAWMLGGSGPSQALLTDLPAFHSVSLVDAPGSPPAAAPAPSVSEPEPQAIPEPAAVSEAISPAAVEQVVPQTAVQPPQAKSPTEVAAVSVNASVPAARPKLVEKPDKPAVVEAEARQPQPVEASEWRPAPTPASASQPAAAPEVAAARPSTDTTHRAADGAQQPAGRNSPQAADRARDAIASLRNALEQTPGTSADQGGGGLANGMQQVLVRTYQQRVRARIINAWRLPMLPQTAEKLHAVVLLTVDREGEVIRYALAQSSGDQSFDASLQRAVQASSPLPPLPDTITEETQELELRFTPPAS